MQIDLNELIAGEIARAFSWTLIHSLWQGLAAAIIAGLVILCTKRSTARLRYNLLSAVFILFILTTVSTFYLKYNSGNSEHNVLTQNSVQLNKFSPNATALIFNKPPQTFIDNLSSYFDQNASLIVAVWFIVFIVQCLKLISGFYYVQQIRHRQVSAVPNEWKEKMETLCFRLGITQSVMFMQSGIIKMPVVLGYFKPVILVPIGMFTQLPPEQVEAILLHELAHIRRKDYLVNLLQSFAEAIFFFNPAIRWISGIIREEREACCDDIVVAYTTNKTNYLQALVNFNDHTLIKGGYAMALGGNQTCLLNRVKRMLTYENNKLNVMEKLFLVSGLVVFTAFSMVNTKDENVLSAPLILTSKVIQQAFETKPPQQKDIITSTGYDYKVPEEKQKVVVVAEVVKEDTVPSNKNIYTHIYSNMNDDGTTKNSDVTYKVDNGKTYRIKKTNDKITEFYVNDVRISESEMATYKNVIEEIDALMIKNEEQSKQRAEEARKRGEEARIRGDEARKRGEEAMKRGEEARKIGEEAKMRGDEARRKGEDAMKMGEEARVRGEEARKRGDEARVRGEEARIRGEETRKLIAQIVDELIKEKVISNEDNLSFTLNKSTLIVNGVSQSAALHNKVRKLLEKDTDVITYSSSGNTKSSSINRN